MSTEIEEPQDRAVVRIAAHLPDLIVYGNFSAERPSVDKFDGVLMFVDISGFTAMTEKFSTAIYMDRGAEQLVEILNYYISAIVEKVLVFGGDILKFAGDALLALWKVDRKQLKNIITVAIKCSLEIHGLFEDKEVEEGLDIRVKIGLAAGHITMLVFGDETRNYFLVIGQAVDDVRHAQGIAQMNDVILSPNCWQLCDRTMVEIERIADERAVKVNFLKPPPAFNFHEFFLRCMTFMKYYPSGDRQNLLRLACTLDSNYELELSLQKYVMETILKQIDDRQLQDYLSELRPVTIVFVNLMFNDQDKAEVMGLAIQDACVHITSVLKVFRGHINKVFMFDKGCSFLCVFGFPGEKAPDEITRALESAVDIFDFCSQVHRIHTVSIGITSGIVFCGIVGHTVRHEYTVIGQKVNIAARMMMTYPGMVTCDSVTYNGSNLPAYFFKVLPKKVMKGVADCGPIYQCLGLNEKVMFGMSNLICNKNEYYPLIGRTMEINYFKDSMKTCLETNCSQVLVYEGLPGYGKSQLLREIQLMEQEANHRSVAIALTKISFHQHFYTIQILMANVLGLDACTHYKERQISLQNKLKTLLDEKFHCLLNDIFHVQFPMSWEISKMSTFRRQRHLEALFMKILEQAMKEETVIFIIDGAQFVDVTSWVFMERLIQTLPIFIVMALTPFVDLPSAALRVLKSRNTTIIRLGVVRPEEIRKKVCIDLRVNSIPRELDSYLVEGSCGIPFYCEEMIKNLDNHNLLLFQPLDSEEEEEVIWNNMFRNFVRPAEDIIVAGINEQVHEDVCDLREGVRLKKLSPPASLKEICLVQLDSMSLSHQMLVRCAAVMGLTFTTELLFEILPYWNMKIMVKALATLVESNVFHCFSNVKELQLALKQKESSFEVHYRSSCLKSNEGLDRNGEGMLREMEAKVIGCHIIRFCRPMMQKTAYELWLKDQKRAMHLKCAHFLQDSAHQCNHCRNKDFIPYHHFTVDIQLYMSDMGTVKKLIQSAGFKTEEEVICSKPAIPMIPPLFPEKPSPEEVRDKLLAFFDTIIKKMKTSQEGVIPLEPCRCVDILQIVILPLAQHFLALGEHNKALYYFLEITAAYLILSDNYKAYIFLNEGEKLLKTLDTENSWGHIFELATFHRLKSQVCFNMGQMVLAKQMLMTALKFLNKMFPDNLVSLFLQIHVEKNRHLQFLNPGAHRNLPPSEKKLAQLYLEAACFSLLWKIYSLNYFSHSKHYSYLAALKQVNAALETQDPSQIVKAYLDYSLYHYLTGYQGVWFKYEIMAMERIMRLPQKGEGIEIIAYTADKLGYIKYLMGHLDLAIELGLRAHKMWLLLQNPNKYHMVLCRLSKSLFLQNRHKQLIKVLGWLWDLSINEEHIFSKAFFYFVCLDIMLYSGYIYRSFDECLEFVRHNEDNRILRFQSGLLMGLYSCIAIWYARLQKWGKFRDFSNRAGQLVTRRTPSMFYYDGISRYLEGQVLYFQKQMEEQKEKAQENGAELLKYLGNLVKQNATGPVFYPRLYHLMAYVYILLGDGQNCNTFLNTALHLSDIQGNMVEKSWLGMSKNWWYSSSEIYKDQWINTVLSLPTWKDILSGHVTIQNVQKNKFLMKVNILDNPFS